MLYYSIDLETTGLDPEKHQILEIGICECLLGYPKPTAEWHILVIHDEIVTDPYVANMHTELWQDLLQAKADLQAVDGGPDWECIKGTYVCKAEALPLLLKQLMPAKITMAGKNVAFDLSFLNKVWDTKVRYRRLDPLMYFLDTEDEEPPNLEKCCERAGISAPTHRALDDARTVHRLIEAGLCSMHT